MSSTGGSGNKRSSSKSPTFDSKNSNNNSKPSGSGGGPAKKKRRFVPPSTSPSSSTNLSSASDLTLIHQSIALDLVFIGSGSNNRNNNNNCQWYFRGQTVLYVIDNSSSTKKKNNVTSHQHHLALHLRQTCQVEDILVQTVASSTITTTNDESTSSKRKNKSNSLTSVGMTQVPANYKHYDPLAHVLKKPPSSYTEEDVPVQEQQQQQEHRGPVSSRNTAIRFGADAQCCRGSTGMLNSLRVAGVASNMGELRISTCLQSQQQQGSSSRTKIRLSVGGGGSGRSTPVIPDDTGDSNNNNNNNNVKKVVKFDVSQKQRVEEWKNDLMSTTASTSFPANENIDNISSTERKLVQEQIRRAGDTRTQRLERAAETLAAAGKAAMKITVNYIIPHQEGSEQDHLGGLHIMTLPLETTVSLAPHVYTTSGVVGDFEGPRTWVPCLDSAASHHRASRQMTITVTAPMRLGLRAVGCGDNFGSHEAVLHSKNFESSLHHHYHSDDDEDDQDQLVRSTLGMRHVDTLKAALSLANNAAPTNNDNRTNNNNVSSSQPHLIPPDYTSIDSIWATSFWCSDLWTPVGPRSLGFAVGPFKILEDPEYFSMEDEDDDEDDTPEEERKTEEEKQAILSQARKNGEGIRQVFFAPVFERRYIHASANMSLLPPGTTFSFLGVSLPSHQVKMSTAIDFAVTAATVGVPHRALSLVRDILALPAYRNAAYTQIWIPGAVHGGATSGALHTCPEVLINSFGGGAIMDSRMLPPPGHRIPFFAGGRALQFLQARCAIRGWITAALPLGGRDDVGFGYIHSVFESFLMHLYEKGHGAFGEGGARGGVYFTKRYAIGSGLNSINLDFLPIANIEESELDVLVGGIVGAIPTEDRNNDQLWRTLSNGTESHTSALDESCIRELLVADTLEALERGEKETSVPLPSMGWIGSHLSLSFLSSNASSSTDLGCGAVELAHPIGGMTYRVIKSEVFRRITEGRAGLANVIRLIRAGFIAAHLHDMGETKLKWEDPNKQEENNANNADDDDKKGEKKAEGAKADGAKKKSAAGDKPQQPVPRPPFVVCVDKLLSKGGFTHTLFVTVLRSLAGPIREANLRGSLVDCERNVRSSSNNKHFVEPEGFPNSYVRGASLPYLRVGAHVEPARSDGSTSASAIKGIQLHVIVEPCIPEGGIAFSGPATLRIVENEGQLREFAKSLSGFNRSDWGPIFLHAKPVTTAKQQTAASGIVETSAKDKKKDKKDDKKDREDPKSVLTQLSGDNKAFDENNLHAGGYQAIELVRLTNRTPLLWIRVDPQGLFGGRVSIFQPDACLGEQLFHDGDSGAQVDAMRSLAERPLKIQGSVKINNVYDVAVSELPVRLLADCLRGTPALHGALPHTPAARAQAALAMGQWQNNKAPVSKDIVGSEHWIGVNLLIQYFKERFFKNGIIMPVKFTRTVVKKEGQTRSSVAADGSASKSKADLAEFFYVDEEDATTLDGADEIEVEEDEEHRVRSAVVQAIAGVRAKDGMTPSLVIKFLEAILDSGDGSVVGTIDTKEEDSLLASIKAKAIEKDEDKDIDLRDDKLSSLVYVSTSLIADALLAVCSINVSPAVITDPTTGKVIQAQSEHPVQKLLDASKRWLEWELYRETIRADTDRESQCGIGGNCFDNVAACAVTALVTLTILRQSTTDEESSESSDETKDVTRAQFYINVFDSEPRRSDVTRSACAQAVACICCAADRFETNDPPVGLLTALEFLLDRIVDPLNSPGLRQSLALIMLDACTGKVCSMQRVGVIGGRSDLYTSASRYFNGPLGATQGGDNGSAVLMTVSPLTHPAASAVNDGARRGLRLLARAGHNRDGTPDNIIARVARFCTNLWRIINGHCIPTKYDPTPRVDGLGVCANDGILRCSLLALWQWVWPKGCFAVLRVQSWRVHETSARYKELGADKVMQIYDEENEAANAEEKAIEPFVKAVATEIDRQKWRGEMAAKAYEYNMEKRGNSMKDGDQIGEPLPPIQRDACFKQGGWNTSTARQRRSAGLDGGMAVTKLRLTVKGAD